MLDALTQGGLERIDEVGVRLRSHRCTTPSPTCEGDGDDGHLVDEVLRAGYRWKGVVLRPAMVKVKG